MHVIVSRLPVVEPMGRYGVYTRLQPLFAALCALTPCNYCFTCTNTLAKHAGSFMEPLLHGLCPGSPPWS